MKNTPEILYTARDTAEFAKLTDQAQPIVEGLAPYLEFLREWYTVTELPRAILFTTRETATERISDLPLPAYTNEYRIVFCPDVAVWRTLLCSQLNDLTVSSAEIASITSYYHTEYGIPHVRQILGHGLSTRASTFPAILMTMRTRAVSGSRRGWRSTSVAAIFSRLRNLCAPARSVGC